LLIGEVRMARWRIQETSLDCRVAEEIEQHASPATEEPAKIVTLAADERLLFALTAGTWLLSRAGTRRQRSEANHLAINVIATNIVARALKHLLAQKRPDRALVHGRRRGIPRSGEPYGAFPSGHAMYVGAISSALSRFFPSAAPLIWTAGGLVAATRVLLLAHWTSDVIVGLTSGIGLEHLIWRFSRASPRAPLLKSATPHHVPHQTDQDRTR
jgi:membrane-associated phospholipid phosphatase